MKKLTKSPIGEHCLSEYLAMDSLCLLVGVFYMKNDYYKQCRFKKGNHETIAYIPSWAAIVGNKVQLISLDNELWTVTEAGENVPADFVKDNERNYKEFQHSTKGGGID